MKLKFLLQSLFAIMTVYAIFSCSQKEVDTPINSEQDIHYYSKEDIVTIKSWLMEQTKSGVSVNFPQTTFKPPVSSASDSVQMTSYINAIRYMSDDIIDGKKADYARLIGMINKDELIDANGRIILLSMIQFSSQVIFSKEATEFYKVAQKYKVELRGACCDNLTEERRVAALNCKAGFGCEELIRVDKELKACQNMTPTCPNGFVFDGANCWSKITFPSGYEGFVFGGGFYTKRNCKISTKNDCCPPGYLFDGANCHYYGTYFSDKYTPFIWNRTFYVKPCRF
jgi:hypothetical protein